MRLNVELLVEHDLRGLLALSHLRTGRCPLLVAGPQTGWVVLNISCDPEHQNIDAAISAVGGRVLGDMQSAARRSVPRHGRLTGIICDLFQDRCGDAIMDG